MSTKDPSWRYVSVAFKEWLTVTEIYDADLMIESGASRRTVSRLLRKVRETTPLGALWRSIDASPQVMLKSGYKPSQTEYHYSCLPWSAVILYEIRYRPGGVSEATVQYLVNRTHPKPYDHKGRLGTGTLATAEKGDLLRYITELMGRVPKPKAAEMRRLCVERFGEEVAAVQGKECRRVPMPSIRSFQLFVRPLRMPEGL